ncbi:aminoacyl-tRNA hydrolase [Candidatus Gottesmanbacteria bacterium]|nr:aminoacyl-tRNA hydrolase [Candidatus Gottesmanbacteria bacterium]
MRLIVGLGNPGEKFQYTRHNIGFMVVERLVKNKLSLLPSLKAWKKDEKFNCEVCKLPASPSGRDDLLVIKPSTYMNLSGMSVAKMAQFYKINTPDVWVVHDDIDLPLGKIRIRKGGASAGHHGIESIIKYLGSSDFMRFRLGIGKGKLDKPHTADHNLHRHEVEQFVVSPFRDSEGGEVKKIIKNAVEALEIALDKGLEKAMNRFN